MGRMRGIVTGRPLPLNTPVGPRPRGGGWRCASLLAALLVVASCGTTTRRSTVVRPPEVTARTHQAPASAGPAPPWTMLPVSWNQLSEIERWLADRPNRRGYWTVEAHLQLAEGRLSFANERRAPGTPGSIVAYRQQAALEGYEGILSNPDASADQRARARLGAQRVGAAPITNEVVAVADVGGLIRRSSWRARRVKRTELSRARAPWQWITVHHSVVRSEDYSPEGTFDTVRGIQRDHMDSKGWGDIGYHFLIDPAGRVIEGRELQWQGAHAGGQNNIGNVGICLLGNFDEDRPSRASIASLDRLVLELQQKLRIPRLNVRPHRAWKETACPGRHLMPWFTRG